MTQIKNNQVSGISEEIQSLLEGLPTIDINSLTYATESYVDETVAGAEYTAAQQIANQVNTMIPEQIAVLPVIDINSLGLASYNDIATYVDEAIAGVEFSLAQSIAEIENTVSNDVVNVIVPASIEALPVVDINSLGFESHADTQTYVDETIAGFEFEVNTALTNIETALSNDLENTIIPTKLAVLPVVDINSLGLASHDDIVTYVDDSIAGVEFNLAQSIAEIESTVSTDVVNTIVPASIEALPVIDINNLGFITLDVLQEYLSNYVLKEDV
jgi:hypothetical protein